MLQIKNPHSVLAALDRRPQDVKEISLPSGRTSNDSDAWARVAQFAKNKGIKVVQKPGISEASVREKESIPVEELFSNASKRAGGKGLWIALDSLQDPHNVGAIFRVAGFFEVQGILLTQERSAPMSSTVYDVSSGGVEYTPFTLQTNLQRGFEAAKEAGLWILGTSEHANDDLRSIQRDRPWLLVLGNEERGIRRLTEESCDVMCGIKPRGKVTSLNVSVAAGVLISYLSGGVD